jgi:hypothetical protein
MGVRRKKPEPEPPPPPLGIAIDGSNVTASATSGAARRLRQALDWCAAFGPSLPVVVFFDAATLRRLGAEAEAALREVAAASGAQLRVAAPGSPADPALLVHAHEARSLVLTNDRFWDFEDLRRDVILLQFSCDAAGFRVPEEATWFLPSGAARRVGVDALRPAGDGAPQSRAK